MSNHQDCATDDYVRDPNLALGEKWRRFKADKGRRGGKSGYYLNKWVPWYFFSVLFGAYAWYALAAVPAHHFRDPFWYMINEVKEPDFIPMASRDFQNRWGRVGHSEVN